MGYEKGAEIVWPYSRPLESEHLGAEPSNLYFNNPLQLVLVHASGPFIWNLPHSFVRICSQLSLQSSDPLQIPFLGLSHYLHVASGFRNDVYTLVTSTRAGPTVVYLVHGTE